MGDKIKAMAAVFFVRMVIGIGIIFFVNQYLEINHIDACVGINGISAVASGFLGLPGVGLLYGIEFYRFL